MREKLLNNKKIFEDTAYELWKGNGADIGKISEAISETASILIELSSDFNDEDKASTVAYVKAFLSDYEAAYNNRDDFLMADCLYYEWNDIILVYLDVIEEK